MCKYLDLSKDLIFLFDETISISADWYDESTGMCSFTCNLHGLQSKSPSELKRLLKAGKAPCTQCNIQASRIKTLYKKYGKDILVDRVVFVDTHTPIIVGCKKHGYFEKTPLLLYKSFCTKCSRANQPTAKKAHTPKEVELKLKSKFGDKYEFDTSNYSGRNSVIKVRCAEHGWFSKKYANVSVSTVAGCTKCAHLSRTAKKRKSSSLYDLENKKKQCKECRLWININDYPVRTWNDGVGKRVSSICADCKEQERLRFVSYNALRILEARLRHKKRRGMELQEALGSKTDVNFDHCFRCNILHCYKGDVNLCQSCLQSAGGKFSRMVAYVKRGAKTCKICSGEFYHFEIGAGDSYCSDKCLSEAKRLIRKKNANSGNIRRRCKKHGAYYEPVNRNKVLQRDSNRCKACNIKVQRKDIYADNAAELDHIVPLSKGGAHTYSNIQTLCRKCNAKKGDNMPIGVQPTLFCSLKITQ